MNVEEIRKKVRSLCEDAGLQFFFAVPNASEWAVTDCEHLRKIVSYHKELETLPLATPTQNWIPVSERLPEERGMYIVTEKVFSVTDKEHAGGFNLMTEQVEFDNGKWRRASFYEVMAWMPLPKPYKESEKA